MDRLSWARVIKALLQTCGQKATPDPSNARRAERALQGHGEKPGIHGATEIEMERGLQREDILYKEDGYEDPDHRDEHGEEEIWPKSSPPPSRRPRSRATRPTAASRRLKSTRRRLRN